MPFTQSFDQFFAIAVMMGAAIYLLRIVLGVALLVVGAIPSRLGAPARAAGQRVTPRLIMKIITAVTGLLVAATGIGATTALAAPDSSNSASANSQSGEATYHGFDDLDDLVAIDRGPTNTANSVASKARPKAETKTKTQASAKPKVMSQPQTSVKEKASAAEQTRQRSTVIVRQGDTLWSIAAKSLGSKASDADIDREWRRWYRTNVDVVGSNPHVIVPGMKLEAPRT